MQGSWLLYGAVSLGPLVAVFLVAPFVLTVLSVLARWWPDRLAWFVREQESDGGNPTTARLWSTCMLVGVLGTTLVAGRWLSTAPLWKHALGGAIGGLLAAAPVYWLGRYGFAGMRVSPLFVVLLALAAAGGEALVLVVL
jgi:hypothetical protein